MLAMYEYILDPKLLLKLNVCLKYLSLFLGTSAMLGSKIEIIGSLIKKWAGVSGWRSVGSTANKYPATYASPTIRLTAENSICLLSAL